MESVFRIPKRHNDVCVDRSRHSSSYPRSSLIHFCTAFLPFPIPGLPIPMYFANGLSFRTAVTRIPSPSSSNCNRSPARTPSRRLTSRGIVTCPLLVTFACFFNVALIILYFNTKLLTFGYCSVLISHLQNMQHRPPS